MSVKPFTLAELIYSAWACGVTIDQVLAEAAQYGFTTCKAEIEATWANYDAEYDAYVAAQQSKPYGQYNRWAIE